MDQNKRNRDIWTFKLLCNTHNRYKCEKRSLQHIGSEEKKSFSKSLDRMSTQFNNNTNHHLQNNEAFLYKIFPSSWSVLPHCNHNSKNNDNDECKKEDYENAFSSNLVCSFFFSCVGAYGIIIQIKTDKSLCAKL